MPPRVHHPDDLNAPGTGPLAEEGMATSQAFSNEHWYRQLLRKRGESAQVCIDALQKILALVARPSPLSEHQWDNWLTALLRLSKRSIRLPSCLYVTGIRQIERNLELQTPTTDIFHGTYQGQRVILKRYRFCTGMLSLEAHDQMLIKEAIIWANHQHVGILPFIGVFRLEDNPLESGLFLVSPFLEHGTIVAYLKTHPRVNRRLLMSDILDAMSYLHSKKLVHGDIKGANILVDASGRACIADLGFSRLTEPDVITWTSIQSVYLLGTYAWQAPEQLQAYSVGNTQPPTRAADIYSIGCLCYEVFTDHPPFWDVISDLAPSLRPARIMKEVVKRGRLPSKPEPGAKAYRMCGLSEEIWETMDMCWQRDPSLRPSASQLCEVQAFASAIDDRPPHAA